MEVLRYMAEGCLNKQIADKLDVTEQTVKNHITSILRKLNANARTQAVVIAIKKGLVTLSSD
jgi:two-component system response regulator DegU